MKKIVSVQDISCYGQCSLTIALPIISSYGIETAILPSAILSTHTGGFKDIVVIDLTEKMPDIISHWEKENIKYDAIYSGYIASAKQFDYIKSMQTLLNDDAIKFVDPAFADHGKIYTGLGSDIVSGMKQLCEGADYIIPNISEVCFLLAEEYKECFSIEEIKQMAKRLQDNGSKNVIITGINLSNEIGVFVKGSKDFLIKREKIAKSYHGTGDIFSSVFISNILNDKSIEESVSLAMDFVSEAINNTITDENHNYGVHFESVLFRGKNNG